MRYCGSQMLLVVMILPGACLLSCRDVNTNHHLEIRGTGYYCEGHALYSGT
jgi:hypothetical protein